MLHDFALQSVFRLRNRRHDMGPSSEKARPPALPHLGVFAVLFAVWCLFFHVVGNSSFGYVHSHSFFGWLTGWYQLTNVAESGDELCPLIPFLVAILLWMKRDVLAAVPKRVWPPGLVLVALGVLLHVAAFLVQQVRISGFAFLLGGVGIMAALWGPRFLRAIAFPWFLLIFALPLDAYTSSATMPLRLLSTTLSAGFCKSILGLKLVIEHGTQVKLPPTLTSPGFNFEVVAACSGIRSASVILLISLVHAYLHLRTPFARVAIVLASVPLAVFGNVVRLIVVFVVGDAFGESVAKTIETRFGFLTYGSALLGVLFLGHLLSPKTRSQNSPPPEAAETASP